MSSMSFLTQLTEASPTSGQGISREFVARVGAQIDDHVIFFNQFIDQPTLLDFISMCIA